MITITKRLDDPSGVVSKLVFEGTEGAIVETVAYRYEDRGVICFSCQSGCPIGCTFCGTGKKFIRSLSAGEMAQMCAEQEWEHLQDSDPEDVYPILSVIYEEIERREIKIENET